MKYIVVYSLIIFCIFSSESAAQKPALLLLPTNRALMPHEAMIDTSAANDSLVFFIPNQKTNREGEVILQQKKAESDSLFPKRFTNKKLEGSRRGSHTLNIKSLNPVRFLIYITAYKIYIL